MNLLNMLTGAMTSNDSLDALSGKTGTSNDVTSTLVSVALPMLLGALTNNASSQDGAQSLLGALNQHTSTETMAQQLQNADAEDGEKIIQHIFGGNSANVIQSLSGQTGASNEQVTSLLNNMAPAMMSGLSAATTSASNASAGNEPDFSALLGAFGGEPTEAPSAGVTDLLGGLFGGSSGSSGSPLGELVGGLFGGGANAANAAPSQSAFDGSSLLGALTSLLH